MESSSEDLIVAALRAATAPQSLTDVAQVIGRSPPATLRQLQRLVERGAVLRTGNQKRARYQLAASFEVAWTLPARGTGAAVAERWSFRGEVDWRFPLTTRIVDALGRETAIRFLETCGSAGVFSPWLCSYVDLAKNSYNAEWASLSVDERRERIRAPSNHGDVNVYAYGSCIRGDTRRDSDLDIILVHGLPQKGVPSFPYSQVIEDLTGALNLGSPRRIDARVFGEDEFFDGLTNMHERVRQEILREGITIYSTSRDPMFLETRRLSLEEAVKEWTNAHA